MNRLAMRQFVTRWFLARAADGLLCTRGKKELAPTGVEMLSVVALLEDLPGEGLGRAQVGTVVENWAPGVYEVEFCDDDGGAHAMVALKAAQLMWLHHGPTRTKLPEQVLPNHTGNQ